MYEIPSNPQIEKCVITKETVLNGKGPEVTINENKQTNINFNLLVNIGVLFPSRSINFSKYLSPNLYKELREKCIES